MELLVTLAVAAILLSFGVPSMRTFVQDSRVNGAADGFLSAVQRARSEAIMRGNPVILCRSGDPSTDTCGGDNKNWSEGWLMYSAPTGGDGDNYDSSSTSDHVLLSKGSATPDGISITSDGDGNSWLTFGSDGTLSEPFTNGDTLVAYAICDSRGEAFGRLIVLPELGRPHMTTSKTNSPIDELSSGPGAPDCLPNN